VRPVNVNGVYNINGSISFGVPVHFLKGSFDISSNASYSRDKQLTADATNKIEANKINTITVGPNVRLNTSPGKKINLYLGAGINYSESKYSIQSNANSKYFNQEYSSEFDWQLPVGFFFASDFTYSINNQHAPGFNARVPLWNASLSKQVLRFNRGEIKFSVKDIFNQNVGISRSTNQNYIEDSRVNSLRRFFLLSFTYSLSKTGTERQDREKIILP
jgi:hypothetical protein